MTILSLEDGNVFSFSFFFLCIVVYVERIVSFFPVFFCFCLYCSVSTMAFSLKVPCFAKPRSSLEVPKELLIDSVPPSEIVIGGGRACEVSVGHFGGQKVALKNI